MQTNLSICELLLQVCHDNDLQPIGYPSPAQPKPINNASSPLRNAHSSSAKNVNALISLKTSALQDFHFTRADLLMIAFLYQQQLEFGRSITINNLLKSVCKDTVRSLELIPKIARLALDGIITLIRPGSVSPSLPLVSIHNWPNIADDLLFGFETTLSKPFINFLLDEQRTGLDEIPYESNGQFLADAYKCCLVASRYYNVPKDQWRIDMYDLRADDLYSQIKVRFESTSIHLPFKNLIDEFDLEPYEQMALWHLIHRETYRLGSTPELLTAIVEPDVYSKSNIDNILDSSGKLQSEGLINISTATRLGETILSIRISPDIFRQVTNNDKSEIVQSSQSITSSNSAILLTTPNKRLSEVVLTENTKEVILSALNSMDAANQKTLKEWGLNDDSGVDGLLLLLHGLPGTGKTLTAEAVATELGRKLMRIDISQVYGKFVGESEKNLRSVINAYKDLARKSDNPPILFLNECDQFLTKRVTREGDFADQTLNILQNMLLEFLEQFNGILIATTNLVSNLDPAFSRRFTHKIEIPWPDLEARKRLWKTLVPDSLPLNSDFDEHTLAARYSFTGSQIQTVIHNTARHIASMPNTSKVISMTDLIKFAELEKLGAFDDSAITKIGFN